MREAIKILTYLGVLESKRSEGTFVCSGFQESMIDPMIYGMILNQDSFDNLMELREMVEAGIMRLASAKYNEEDGRVLEQLLDQMRGIVPRRWPRDQGGALFLPWTTSSTTWSPRWERTPWPTRSAGWCAP